MCFCWETMLVCLEAKRSLQFKPSLTQHWAEQRHKSRPRETALWGIINSPFSIVNQGTQTHVVLRESAAGELCCKKKKRKKNTAEAPQSYCDLNLVRGCNSPQGHWRSLYSTHIQTTRGTEVVALSAVNLSSTKLLTKCFVWLGRIREGFGRRWFQVLKRVFSTYSGRRRQSVHCSGDCGRCFESG